MQLQFSMIPRTRKYEGRVARFLAKVQKSDEPGGCWLWTACKFRDGYGYFCNRGAHRVSYEMFTGPIPQGLYILHSCNTPLCVNPAHLRTGTAKDNMADALAAGHLTGPRTPHAFKLTQESVDEMRALHTGGTSNRQLAARFGVDRTYVTRVLRGERWKDSPDA